MGDDNEFSTGGRGAALPAKDRGPKETDDDRRQQLRNSEGRTSRARCACRMATAGPRSRRILQGDDGGRLRKRRADVDGGFTRARIRR